MRTATRTTAFSVLLALLLTACAARAPVTERNDAPADAEAPLSTPGGKASFLMPDGWGRQDVENAVVLTPPEADGSRLAILDASADTPDAAVAEGWKLLGMSPKMLVATDAAPRNGWEQRRFYSYDVPQNAKRVVWAGAFRNDQSWTVVLQDLDQAIAEKRGSQLGRIFQRLQPVGHARESFAGRPAHTLDAARLDQLVAFVEQMRQAFEVPGVAIGIVQNGKVVLSRGFGVRSQGKPEPVDGDTRFMIASNTKALTTLMLAKLVDAGKLAWHARARDVYPPFRLGDAATTDQVLIEHLICACTGLPRQDYEWLFEGEKQSPETVISTLSTMQPTSGFGELFQYSNPMAAAAGFIGGQVAYPGSELGAGYDQAMQALVFDPLGMSQTTFDYGRAQTGNYASPHGYDIDRKVQAMGMGLNNTIVASRPAGAAWGTVNDLLRYVQMEIDEGLLPDGTRYIGRDVLLQRRDAQVSIGVDRDYAMGLMVDRSEGVTLVDHGGALFGFHSNMMWWPEHKVGAVMLTNADEGMYMLGPFKRRLSELLFDGDSLAQAAADASVRANREGFAAFRKLLQLPPNPEAVAGLATHYRNDALGDLFVRREGEHLAFDLGSFASEMATQQQPDGSLAFVTIDPMAPGFPFVRADSDGVRKLIVRDGQHEYVFEEVR